MSEEALELFYGAGLTNMRKFPDTRELIFSDKKNSLEYLLIRSKDVGTYVEQGAADLGVMGYDLLKEHEFDVKVPLDLRFGYCRLCVAYPQAAPDFRKNRNLRVATKYPRIASRYFFERGYNIQIVGLYGSIEIAPLTGLSDIIVDLVSTGNTLKANHLVEDEMIMESTARLIVNPGSLVMKRDRVRTIIQRVSEVLANKG